MQKKIRIGKCLLLDILKKRHMTQADLSVITGIPRQTINLYIKENRLMSIRNAVIISCALRCTVNDLYEVIIDE